MADDKPEETTPSTQAEEAALRKAKVGVKDKGEVVSTAFDEPISGTIADISDGD